MQLRLQIFSVLGIYIFLISATPILKRDTSKIYKQNIALSYHNNSNLLKIHKLNFFQKLMVKFYLRKNKLQKANKTDKLASVSLWLGIGACGLIFLSLLFPYFIFLSLPAGIAAMITGHSAIRNKTSFAGKARMGRILGLLAIIIFAVLFVVVVYILATSGSSIND